MSLCVTPCLCRYSYKKIYGLKLLIIHKYSKNNGSCVVYEPDDQYVGRHVDRCSTNLSIDMSTDISADISTDMSVAMLTDTSRSIYRPSVGRHVDR